MKWLMGRAPTARGPTSETEPEQLVMADTQHARSDGGHLDSLVAMADKVSERSGPFYARSRFSSSSGA